MNELCGSRSPRKATFGWLALAAILACPPVVARQAQVVVTDNVVSQAQRTQTNVPVTFGQVFKIGDVPKGQTVRAALDGRSIPVQVDVKARNPDGSLRHAVLTVRVPELKGGAKVPLAISAGTALAAGAPLGLSQLLATQYDAKASLVIGGVTYTADARTLLQAVGSGQQCHSWSEACVAWLSGSLVSEWVVHGPLKGPDGKANPNLRVSFGVRVYAGNSPGSIGQIRTDVAIENSWAYTQPVPIQYTATLTSGSARFQSEPLTQFAYTRWHQVLWWNDVEPEVYMRQDTQYIQSSLAVSKYEKLQPSNTFLSGVRQTCKPLDHCDQTNAMGNPGSQAAIGPLPRWTSVYIVDPDVRAYRWMLANTDALGSYPVHYRDQGTDWPLSIQKHPYVTILNWASANNVARSKSSQAPLYRKDLLPHCVADSDATKECAKGWYVTISKYTWSNAHQPAAGYVAYMVTGSYYYMEEMAFYASMTELSANETYRGLSKGLLDKARSQIRGKAWGLRTLADAAWLLPDSYPLKAEFNADVNNSLADFNATYTNNPSANPLGMMNSGHLYPISGHGEVGGTPWQHSFLTWSVGHAADLGFPGAAAFRNWLAKFEIGLMTDWLANPTHGFCWLQASAYKLQVMDDAREWLPNFTAVYAASFPSLVGLTCNSQAMVDAVQEVEHRPRKIGEMSGYAYSATGFPANTQIGLATAADTGLPNASRAWTIFESRSIKPKPPNGYDDFPNFAVVPRSTATPPNAKH